MIRAILPRLEAHLAGNDGYLEQATLLAMLGCALRANDLDLSITLWDIAKRDAARLATPAQLGGSSPVQSLLQEARSVPYMDYAQALVEEELLEIEQHAEGEGGQPDSGESDDAQAAEQAKVPHPSLYHAMIGIYGKHGRWGYVGVALIIGTELAVVGELALAWQAGLPVVRHHATCAVRAMHTGMFASSWGSFRLPTKATTARWLLSPTCRAWWTRWLPAQTLPTRPTLLWKPWLSR